MSHAILWTADAERDLEDIADYIAEYDSLGHAAHVIDKILALVHTLAQFPAKGNYPKELEGLGNREFRQLFFKPYRVTYQIDGRYITIMLVADGRRDMSALLARRLLGCGPT